MIYLVLLPALIHVYIFVLESFLWGRPATNKTFNVDAEGAKANKLLAFNQGFYNLLLALAIIVGLLFRVGAFGGTAGGFESGGIGLALMLYGLISIIVAGLVLICSSPKLWRSALIQILPAVLGLVVVLV